MDTIRALTNAIYGRLKADSELAAFFPDRPPAFPEWLYLVWAAKDSPFPYLVHRIDDRSLDPWVMRQGTYYIDIWDYSQTAVRTYGIRHRLVTLLDKAVVGLVDPQDGFLSCIQPMAGDPRPVLVAARLYLGTSGFVPEATEHIWHHAMTFRIRFTRSLSEVENMMIERSQGSA
jgi:hypothetical protein